MALFAASLLKLFSVVMGRSDQASWMATVSISFAELCVGAWLLMSRGDKLSSCVCALLFLVFAGVNVRHVVAASSSCGCFGNVAMPPSMVLMGDLLAAMVLVPRFLSPAIGIRRLASLPAMVVFAGALAVGYVGSAVAESKRHSRSGVQYLDADAWLGRQLPNIETVPSIDLSGGNLIALIYDHECSACQSELGKCIEFARSNARERIALIEVPPYGAPISGPQNAIIARLRDDGTWYGTLPILISLNNGVVDAVARDIESLRERRRDLHKR